MVLLSDQEKCYERSVSDDLVMLTGDLTEENLHDMLWSRFQEGNIYTSIGNVLISVNPYEKIRKGGKLLYSDEVATRYSKYLSGELSPHIFTIAADAFAHLQSYGKNQTIVVTGESGAG
jgi:myosin-1